MIRVCHENTSNLADVRKCECKRLAKVNMLIMIMIMILMIMMIIMITLMIMIMAIEILLLKEWVLLLCIV